MLCGLLCGLFYDLSCSEAATSSTSTTSARRVGVGGLASSSCMCPAAVDASLRRKPHTVHIAEARLNVDANIPVHLTLPAAAPAAPAATAATAATAAATTASQIASCSCCSEQFGTFVGEAFAALR